MPLIKSNLVEARPLCGALAGMCLFLTAAANEVAGHDMEPTPKTVEAIPWDQIGAKVEPDYKGDRLSVAATIEGARLRCLFQRLEGEAGSRGLWLTSTVSNRVNDRFRVVAAKI